MEEARNYGKFYASKTFLKMAGGRMHTPHSTPLAVSYRNHQKSQAYFSHLALLILFFFTKSFLVVQNFKTDLKSAENIF